MANICSTTITINCDDMEKLLSLEKDIRTWTKEETACMGQHGSWLGNIVLHSGIGTVDSGKETDLSCRGDLTYMEVAEGQLIVQTSTKWKPMIGMWVKLLEKYLPEAELVFAAEEIGTGLFETNDPCLAGLYVVDSSDHSCLETMYDKSAEQILPLLNEYFDLNCDSIDRLKTMIASREDRKVYIHKWEMADVSDWW